MADKTRARLILEDGAEFTGELFGAKTARAGEVVFTTGMTGYPQSLTDPSFRGQILTFTYPLLGNYGVPLQKKTLAPETDEYGIPLHFESPHVQAAGVVASECCEEPSHWAQTASLSRWLAANGVPGIVGIDTRALTKRLRERGTMRGKIVPEGKRDIPLTPEENASLVEEVSVKEVTVLGNREPAPGSPRILLIDCGVKANILRCLLAQGCTVIRAPYNADIDMLEAGGPEYHYDGIFLSNGPGDPKACSKTIALTRRALKIGKPVFGVCLGNQIMALAAGADTYKLPYGHRSQNQPCIDVNTGRVYITSQNHGYAVRAETLPPGWKPWFLNANDNTIEGIVSAAGPFKAVQFHPEGCPGPRDTEFLIDNFLAEVCASI